MAKTKTIGTLCFDCPRNVAGKIRWHLAYLASKRSGVSLDIDEESDESMRKRLYGLPLSLLDGIHRSELRAPGGGKGMECEALIAMLGAGATLRNGTIQFSKRQKT